MTVRLAVDGYPLSGRRTGIGRWTAELLKAAAGRLDVTAVRFPHPEPGGTDDLTAAGVHVRVPAGVLMAAFRVGHRMGVPIPFDLLAPRHDVALYTSYRWYPTRRTPTIGVVHDLAYLRFPQWVGPAFRELTSQRARETVRRSAVVVALSETLADDLAEAYPEAANRLVVLRAGPTPGLRPPPVADVERRLRDLGLERGFALSVGTLEPRKNLAALVEAHGLLAPSQRAAMPLVIVGGRGWLDEPVVAAIRTAGSRVRHLDHVPDDTLAALYAGAALFAFPSRYEGLGLPLLEAMAAGTPVICSDIPVFHEVCGNAASYFDPLRPDAIAEALRDPPPPAPPAQFAAFSWASTAARLASECERLVGRTYATRPGSPPEDRQ